MRLHKRLFRLAQKSSGFTLVELLVTIAISFIIVTTLLNVVVNILSSERREEAKVNAEQEIQAALDYIADDLQEAVYIYDADGIAAIKNQLPLPAATDIPVLVFWKRNFLSNDLQVVLRNGITTTVGCLTRIADTNACDDKDYSVYSLVVYYSIKDNDSAWSNAVRIGRWELQDGIKNTQLASNSLLDSEPYLTNPAPGFQLFDLSLPGTIKDKMNAWTKDRLRAYDLKKNQIVTLVDYIDPSTGNKVPLPINCANISSQAQLVPANNTIVNPLGLYSFYACVDSSKNFAHVYLRGNALARLEQNATYSDRQSAFFPSGILQVRSKGSLGKL